jgi:RNA polymerase sigma factor (sigma-70 family)
MTSPEAPQTRFPFLARALSDADAAERLGQLLSDEGPVGENEHDLISRIQQELVARAHKLLNRLFPRLEGQFEPYELVKDFSMSLRSSFLSKGMNMVSKAELFAWAQKRMRGIILDRLRRSRHQQEHMRLHPPLADPSAARASTDHENLVLVLEAVERLDPELKAIFDMKLSGLTYREIEAQIGLAPATAQRRWENASRIIESEISRLAGDDHGERRTVDGYRDRANDD